MLCCTSCWAAREAAVATFVTGAWLCMWPAAATGAQPPPPAAALLMPCAQAATAGLAAAARSVSGVGEQTFEQR